tara:strand:- start:449 stop:730 length:282 start_codon:yes stop_codon:yes gene_type:complete
MTQLCILVLVNIILLLVLIYAQKCNTTQIGGEEDKMDINKFMDDTKSWCSNNYDNIIKMTKAYTMCKKSGAEEFNTIAEISNSEASVTDILYQ